MRKQPISPLVRRGFVLPLVFGAMAVLTMYFFIMSFLSSGQTTVASHFIDSAHSLAIAKAGADWALTEYASGSYQPGNIISEAFFGESTAGGEFELQYPGELHSYVENELHGELVVKMKIYDVTHLPVPDKLQGFRRDQVEKSGIIEFTSVGKVGKASRRVRVRKGFKVVMIVHPVVSKFTLFLRTKPEDKHINVLERKTTSFGFENGIPIILNNQGFDEKDPSQNLSFPVIRPSTQEFDLSLVAGGNFSKLVQTSGWIFLNSGADPWTFNLSGSGDYSEYDDRLLLRVGRYRKKDLEKSIPTGVSTGEVIKDVWEKFQGMKSDYKTMSEAGEVIKKPINILFLRYLFPGGPPKVSLLRPFGTGTKFSPTLLFGPVYMRYLILRGIDVVFLHAGSTGSHMYSNVLLPGFLSLEAFTEAYRVKVPADVKMDGFARVLNFPDRNNVSSIFPVYEKLMTQISKKPYIDALDYIFLKERESGTMLVPKARDYNVPIPQLIGADVSPDISPWIGNRSSLMSGKGTFGMNNKILYDGELANIKGCMEFQAKITAVFPSIKELQDEFMDKKTSELRLPGIVYLGESDLVLDKPLKITSPGIIICGGNVVIRSPIQSTQSVTIVSLKDITVETGSQIDAHLICLMGTFRAQNGFRIVGGLAAHSMDISNMKANEKSITFVPAHDPYNNPDKWYRKTAYRFQLSQEEEYYIEGGS
ncbi:MAG: hypothetical protein CVV42_17810 [Candidatus Riflebacteria bacterium HGW-Riflebacteria-2]|jgi:hypothetical protein|nr:MAG: hypothetical protein CVV42_17810 [Candidatus Riflebacteria bacterium HGW-Riflebacteria-2]